jgi:hypothetical protein
MFSVAAAPTVTGMSPSTGPPGTEVTLTGSGFDTDLADDVVSVKGVRAEVSAVTSTTLKFVVPAGAATGMARLTAAAGSGQAPGEFTIPLLGVDAASIQSVVRRSVGGTPQNVGVTKKSMSSLVLFGPASREVDLGFTDLTFRWRTRSWRNSSNPSPPVRDPFLGGLFS